METNIKNEAGQQEQTANTEDIGAIVSENCESSEEISAFTLESIKFEYEHSIKRSERLDNKIYISLAIYAFLIGILSNSFVVCQNDSILVGVYYTVFVIVALVFLTMLVKLILLLRPSDMMHFNCISLLEEDDLKTDDASICQDYINYMAANNKKLDKKNESFISCAYYTAFVTIGVMILSFMSKLVK